MTVTTESRHEDIKIQCSFLFMLASFTDEDDEKLAKIINSVLACVAGGIVGFRAHKQKRRSRDSERRSREWLGEELLRPKPLAAAPLVCRGFAARCRGFAACLCALNPTIPPATQATQF